jgi:hypothetical protein
MIFLLKEKYMKKIMISCGFGLALLTSASALAGPYQFKCPDPSKLMVDSKTNAIIYAPYDPSSGMPENLAGNGGFLGIYAGWEGLFPDYIQFASADFNQVQAINNHTTLICFYKISGKDKSGQNISTMVNLQPGNPDYSTLYNYSLSNGATYSNSIDDYIIAADK